jgi:hypothetical protein
MWAVIANGHPENERANTLKHSGLRVGEIIGYRAWRVGEQCWSKPERDRLCSVYISTYVWDPDKPASGDVRTHGIYSFRNVICSSTEYAHALPSSFILFGKVKVWGEVVEHERGYRSQFARIISLDYGDPKLLAKFRQIYRLNQSVNSTSFLRLE